MIRVLGNSLYPGAAPESIELVLSYCEAAGLDPMQKPVHIVPMWDSKAKRMRDVIMPGVNLYRTQAARSNAFAGMSEPEYGPVINANIGGVQIAYPEWARVTVQRRLATGELATFTGLEYWIENYAAKGGQEKSIAPNAMWQKRPRGQIAKCAAAQALRIAFPELASPPTADEMEGKPLEAGGDVVDMVTVVPPELLKRAKDAAAEGRQGFGAFWKAATPDERSMLQHELAALKIKVEEVDAATTTMTTAGDAAATAAEEVKAKAAGAETQAGEADSSTASFVAEMEAAEGKAEA